MAWLDGPGSRDWRALSEIEWLLTNGLGGYASGTVSGAHTRRYHGLLVAAFQPPTDRHLVFTKIDERLKTAAGTAELASNQWADKAISPQGHQYLQAFDHRPHPTWTYAYGDAELTKEVQLLPGRQAVQIRYRLSPASEPAELELAWLVNYRDAHAETTGGRNKLYQQMMTENGVVVQAHAGAHPLSLAWERGTYKRTDVWYYEFFYAREAERGQSPREDHYNPGITTIALEPGDSVTLTVAADSMPTAMPWQELAPVPVPNGIPAEVAPLVAAADAYLVQRRETRTASLVAGYPWFGEWGRDAMIALPGITLITGRHEQARELIATFIHYMDQGIIPNRFPDDGSTPEYGTIDATLWLFHAVDRYWAYTHDDAFLKMVFPRLAGAIDWYRHGTHNGIRMDVDGLITGGAEGMALTWMDAVTDGHVVTPRAGKCVEIQGLWIHALRVMSGIARHLGEADPFAAVSAQATASFRDQFWSPELGYLYDRIDPEGQPDTSLRPNQVLALAMPSMPFERTERQTILSAVDQHLWTPYGLRTLTPASPDYQPKYHGDRKARDNAYHQGTVWSWLVGPYASAWMRAHGRRQEERQEWRRRLQPLLEHLDRDGCLGQISEIFDAEPPHAPKGSPAQAWSVAELLRAWMEEIEGKRPRGLSELTQSLMV